MSSTTGRLRSPLALAGVLLSAAAGVILMGIITAEAVYPAAYSTFDNEISDFRSLCPRPIRLRGGVYNDQLIPLVCRSLDRPLNPGRQQRRRDTVRHACALVRIRWHDRAGAITVIVTQARLLRVTDR